MTEILLAEIELLKGKLSEVQWAYYWYAGSKQKPKDKDELIAKLDKIVGDIEEIQEQEHE